MPGRIGILVGTSNRYQNIAFGNIHVVPQLPLNEKRDQLSLLAQRVKHMSVCSLVRSFRFWFVFRFSFCFRFCCLLVRFVSFRLVSSRLVSCRFVFASFRFVSFCFASYF